MSNPKQAEGPLRVLMLPPTIRDGEIAVSVLENHDIQAVVCRDIDHICRELELGAGAALVAEEFLNTSNRHLLIELLVDQPAWSDLPLIVLCLPNDVGTANLHSWQQMANVTLIPRPFQIDQFVAVIQAGLRDRNRQYMVKNLLDSIDQRGREFRQLADAMPQLVFIADTQGQLDYINQRAVSYLGAESTECKTLTTCFRVKSEDISRVEREWKKAILLRKPFHCEFRSRRAATNKFRWQLARAEPILKSNGEVRQWYGTCTDIHDRKLAEHQLADALKQSSAANIAKSEFLANMSHEIRTPMTSILGYSELLAQQETDHERRNFLNIIHQNGNFLLEIINDILDLSKIEAGKLAISSEEVNLRLFLSDIESLLKVRAADKRIEFRITAGDAVPDVIQTDPTRLRQILVNLIGNAIKFTEVGYVELSVSHDATGLRFIVRDTGIGISEEQLPKLFQPFQQGDNSVTRQFGGTGLGLAISHRLATILGGSIRVQSQLGRGSVFTLELGPECSTAATPNKSTETRSLPHNDRPDLTEYRILVVDDRRDVRFLSGRILNNAGATVEFAKDGGEAVSMIETMQVEKRLPNLVLMDMQMPVLDGYRATEQLRSMGFRGPIIALTADAMHGDMTRCLECGCDAYLTKPIDTTEMLRVVSNQIQSHSH